MLLDIRTPCLCVDCGQWFPGVHDCAPQLRPSTLEDVVYSLMLDAHEARLGRIRLRAEARKK